jgi:2-polyprenyl-3-methyl-5-hydroxy-6-metoxy-1,4-benzoquinol methylase
MDAQFWDDLYGSRDQLFSGNPNGVLVTEVTGLPPGQALDVGCGEGADAHWLAARGWQVTAIDISEVALRRAAAMDVTGRVAWARANLNGAPPPAGAFDLVSLQYFPLPHQPHHTALRALLAAVAPGGTLLVAAHDLADHNHAAHDAADHAQHQGHAFDPGDFYQPGEIVRLLDDNWTILVDETRPRTAPAPEGTNHINDIVLRAQRIR